MPRWNRLADGNEHRPPCLAGAVSQGECPLRDSQPAMLVPRRVYAEAKAGRQAADVDVSGCAFPQRHGRRGRQKALKGGLERAALIVEPAVRADACLAGLPSFVEGVEVIILNRTALLPSPV